MIKTIGQITNMKAALWVNSFFYYFRRLWIIGKWMPETVYNHYNMKSTLSIAAVIIRQIIDFMGKPLYLLCFVGLPVLMVSGKEPMADGLGIAYFFQILFFLNCIIGSFGDGQVFNVTRDKITYIKYMHMNARSYIKSALVIKYVPFFIYYLPCVIVTARLLGGTYIQGFFIWIILVSFRMIGEAFQLFVFDKTGKVISRNMFYEWAVIAAGAAGAYLPMGFGLNWYLSDILLKPAGVCICLISGGVCLWYITAGYRGYEKNYHHAIDINFLLSSILKASSGTAASFKEVEIKEKDLVSTEKGKKDFLNLKGYSYLNALFFARHRRQLVKPVFYRLLVTAALLAVSVVMAFVNRELSVKLSENLTALLPSFIYVMYFMTVADKASRAMFYNCDKDLLRYAYYRKPKTILKNFQIRLLKVSMYDLAIGGAVCLVASIFCLICGTGIFSADLWLFCIAILLLSILFTVHHLCLYYIFQPYSESLQVKNPFYSCINAGMYILCFMCLQIKMQKVAFTMSVLAFTVLYIAVALILVYRFAPKTFRVK